MADPFIPPTPEEFDALPFVEQVATLARIIDAVLAGFRHRLAVRQTEGRTLSAADQRDLRRLEMQLRCLLIESREHLEPGSLDVELREAFAALAEAQGDGHA